MRGVNENIIITPPQYRRFVASAIVAWSLAGLVAFGYGLLMAYGFSSMVDPELPESQRSQLIARRFLFGDNGAQLILVTLFTAGTGLSLLSALIHACAAIFRWPAQEKALSLTLFGGLGGTVLFISYWVWQAI